MITIENKDLKSIYDLFALCCSHVIKACEKGDFIFPDCNDEEYEAIDSVISGYVCNREQEGKRLALKILIYELVEVVGINCTPAQAYEIAIAIDDKVSVEEPISDDEFSQFVTYSSLNNYLDNEVRVLPVLESTFISKSNGLYKEISGSNFSLFRDNKPASSSIGNFFKNYIVMDKPIIDKYPIKITRAKRDSAFGMEFGNKTMLKIDLIPFTQVDIEQVGNLKYKGNYFMMEGLKSEHEERLLQKQKNFFEDKIRERGDFIVFPEMFFSEKLLDCSKKCANKTEIVINGSIWKNLKNKSIVSVGNSELIVHYKRCPFEYENRNKGKKYTEKLIPLDRQEKEYQILEIEGFGRIAVGVCRDLDYNETQELWKMVKTNLLIIPAYTKSTDMISSARALSELYNMVVVLSNACAAVSPLDMEGRGEDKKAIGFVTLPGILESTRKSMVVQYYKKETCVACMDVCRGHRFIIDFCKIEIQGTQGIKTYSFKWE